MNLALICALAVFASAAGAIRTAGLAGLENLGSSFSPEVVAEFTNVTYDFTDSPWGTEENATAAGAYILENNVVTGVNYYKTKAGETLLFACVPRWRPGVPSTLNIVVKDKDSSKFKLQTWPSWEFNTKTVRYVQSVWVNHEKGLIYIIDTGRENFASGNSSEIINGLASLHVLDIETQRRVYYNSFDPIFMDPKTSFLNDIVVNEKLNIAYMTDTNTAGKGGLLALNMNTGFTRRYEGASTYAEPWYTIEILNVSYPSFRSPVDGITLSEDGMRLFYSAVDGKSQYSLDAMMLATPGANGIEISKTVQNLTQKLSFSDGLRTLPYPSNDSSVVRDAILYGVNGNCGITMLVMERGTKWNSAAKVVDQQMLYQNDTTMQWVDTFAFVPHQYVPKPNSTKGGLVLFTTNRLQDYTTRTMDFTGGKGANMRIFAFFWG